MESKNGFAASRRGAPLSDQVVSTLRNTFWMVAGLLSVTAVASAFAKQLHLGLGATLLSLVGSLVLIFLIHRNRNSGWGVAGLLGFAALMGISLGPLLGFVLKRPDGAALVMTAAGLTAAATAGLAAYAITSRRDFSRIRGFLFAGLVVLVLGSVLGMFVHIAALHLVLSVVGALIFSAYLLLDIGDIVSGRQQNYVLASLDIFLDVLNLFVDLLDLLRR